jgi:hypothetical protein
VTATCSTAPRVPPKPKCWQACPDLTCPPPLSPAWITNSKEAGLFLVMATVDPSAGTPPPDRLRLHYCHFD